jgi:DegV family protein with EDD domain
MKVAVMTDSNSGFDLEESKRIGLHRVFTPIIIEDETMYQENGLTQQMFYEKLDEGKNITTSMPSPGAVMEMWDKLLEDGYDQVVYIPLSSGLSNACQVAIQLSKEYDGKVQVVDDHRVSVTMRQSILDALWMAEQGKSAEEIKQELEANAFNSVIFLAVDDLKYLKKGGRVTPAAAALGTVLNIKPVLTTVGGSFDAVDKVRGMKKSMAKLLDYTEEFMNKMLENHSIESIRIGAAGSFRNKEDADAWYNQVKERFPQIKDVYYDPLSLVVGVHTGPEAAGMGLSVILRDE